MPKNQLICLIFCLITLVLVGCGGGTTNTSGENPSSPTYPVYPSTEAAPVLTLIWPDADNQLSGIDIYSDNRLEIHPFAHRWSSGILENGSYHPYPEEIEIYLTSSHDYMPLYACAAGTVTEIVNNVTQYGQQIGAVADYDVTIRYGSKYLLFYAHVASVEVSLGDTVNQGDKIGSLLPLNDYDADYFELGVGQRTGENSGRYWNPYRFFDATGRAWLSDLWNYVTVEAADTDYLNWDLVAIPTLSADARDSTMSDVILTVFTSGEFPSQIEYWDSSYWTFIQTFQGVDW